MVFIRPTILNTVKDVRDVTGSRYDYLRKRQINFGDNHEGEGLTPLPESLEQINQPEATAPGQ